MEPRIAYTEKESAPNEATQSAYQQLENIFGMLPNIIKVTGSSAPVANRLSNIIKTLFTELSISPKVREMAYLTTAKTNQCGYCTAHHTMAAKQAGVTDEQISQLGEAALNSTGFSDAEKAVIRFALETTGNVKASNETFNRPEHTFYSK